MSNIITAELYKLKYNKTFYICLVLVVALSMFNIFTTTTDTAVQVFENTVGSIDLFLLIVLVGIACDDYENNTMKNLISSGNSRLHIYCGKVVTGIIIGLIYFLVDGFASVVAALITNGFGVNIGALAMMESLFVQLLMMLVYVLTFFGIASIAKTAKLGLIIGIVYLIGIGMVPMLVQNFMGIDIDAFGFDTLVKSVSSLHFTFDMIINFIIYGGIAIIFNLIEYFKFKVFEV